MVNARGIQNDVCIVTPDRLLNTNLMNTAAAAADANNGNNNNNNNNNSSNSSDDQI